MFRAATAVPPPEPCTSKTKSEPFILLEEQKYVVPTFDLQRRLGNVFAQFRYRKLFEKEFTVEGFLNGAIQAVSELQLRFDPFDEDYFKPLKFSINDVICSVIDSSYTCGKMQPDSSFTSEFVKFQFF
ncbi:unnamed protein product [Gongylonema pulchrum]|uniref:Uncharacterized protein n=1 Tax=Gongylonema pulchrum TaxID=637853 RepID=A0A183EAR0_9BILA|nr:unnamed protein product [Gongylonema pulchrum]